MPQMGMEDPTAASHLTKLWRKHLCSGLRNNRMSNYDS